MPSDPTLLPSWTEAPRALVGVCPPGEFHERRRLLQALERVLPVQFAPRLNTQWAGLQAAIVFGTEAEYSEQLRAAQLPGLVVDHGAVAAGGRQSVRLADVTTMDTRLRGQLIESIVATSGLERRNGDGVDLAAAGDVLLWQTSAGAPRLDRVAVAPVELKPDESLRDHLRAGMYFRLLPLLEFLRDITGYQRPGSHIRATFVIDDPNLHWQSYGPVRFGALAAHARANGYHVTCATVPLDCWFAWPGAVRAFRANAEVLSLTSHGAYHLYSELVAQRSREASVRLFEDAASRMDHFGDRWGVPISRVMVPPHNESALHVHDGLVGAGFEALCTKLGWWADWPERDRSVAGIATADFSPSGLPVFGRQGLRYRFAREDALVSAYLDQPVVLYWHPDDFSEGFDVLAEAASWLRGVGPTTWHALGEVAHTNVVTHFDGRSATLHFRVFSRKCHAMAPAATRSASVEGSGSADRVGSVTCAGVTSAVRPTNCGWQSDRLPCQGGRVAEIIIGDPVRDDARRRPQIAPPRAYARRAAVEARDRARPLVHQLGLESLTGAVEAALHARRGRGRTAG